jgi:hypothetical protein
MSDVTVSVVESITSVVVSNDVVEINVTENPVTVSTAVSGPQGASYNQGDPIYVTVRNATGATLPKGTIVYISGSNGNHVQVTPAIATSDATSARTLGWLAASIANNASGLCQVEGYLEGLNTHGLTSGDQLYLSGTTAGGFTATKPQAPIHLVYVGVVTKVSAGDGHVFVKVQNGYELEELHDVQITSPVNNQVLTYDSATDLWKNATNPADGVTSITATAPLTGGTITSTGSIGIDQTALSIAQSQVTNLVTDLAGKASLGAANAFTVGPQTINTGGTANKGLVVQGVASQAVNLFEVQTSAATAVRVNQAGNTTFVGNITSQNNATFTPASAATVPLTVQGAASQTASFIEVQNSSSTTLFRVNSSGLGVTPLGFISGGSTAIASTTTAMYASAAGNVGLVVRGAASQSANLQEWQSSAATILSRISSSGQFVSDQQTYIGSGATSISNARFNVATGSASVIGQVIRGAASQSADLQQWQDSAGNNNISISPTFGLVGRNAGTLSFAISSGNGLGAFYLQSPSQVGMLIRGAASQTANLQEWQNSAGTVLSRIDLNGSISVPFLGSQVAGASYLQTNADTQSISIFAGAAASKGLVVRGFASQTANLQEWQNSAGTVLASVNGAGLISSVRQISVSQSNAGETMMFVRGAASQTGDSFAVRDSSANTIGGFSATGRIYSGVSGSGQTYLGGLTLGGGSVASQMGIVAGAATTVGAVIRGAASQTANLQEWQNSAGTQLTVIDNAGFLKVGNTGTGGQVAITATAAGNRPLVLKGAASQTANLTEWQDSAGTVLASIGSGGALNVNTSGTGVLNLGDGQISKGPGSGFTFNSGLNNVTSLGVGTTALNTEPFRVYFGAATYKTVIRGAASQTANLTEWQNSAGTIQSRITSSGAFVTTSLTASSAVLNTGSAAVVPITARGATSQTANLQQWQISDSTVVARVLADGQFVSSAINTSNNYARMLEANSGGTMQLTKMTAQAGNAGAGIGRIYFRDGTDAGTLKLVVRAGASGAETTILDNIPQ